jgi:hypothetical protein
VAAVFSHVVFTLREKEKKTSEEQMKIPAPFNV